MITATKYTEAEVQEHRAQLVAALRSGEYKQGEGRLCVKDQHGQKLHCCLGVAAELAGLPVRDPGVPGASFEYVTTWLGGAESFETTMLPYDAWEWLGVGTDSPHLAGEGHPMATGIDGDVRMETSLINLNDGGVPFETIADLIESQGLR